MDLDKRWRDFISFRQSVLMNLPQTRNLKAQTNGKFFMRKVCRSWAMLSNTDRHFSLYPIIDCECHKASRLDTIGMMYGYDLASPKTSRKVSLYQTLIKGHWRKTSTIKAGKKVSWAIVFKSRDNAFAFIIFLRKVSEYNRKFLFYQKKKKKKFVCFLH